MSNWPNPRARDIIRDRAEERGWTVMHVGGACFELSKRSPWGKKLLINVEFEPNGELREASSDLDYSPTLKKLGWVLDQLDRNRS